MARRVARSAVENQYHPAVRTERPKVLEFSGSLEQHPHLLNESAAFAVHHFGFAHSKTQQVRSNYRIQLRTRSDGGFTLLRGVEVGGVSSRLQRSAVEIARDNRDGFHLVMNGPENIIDISQHGRTQRVKSGSFALVSEAEPSVVENSGSGRKWTSVVLMMPRQLVDDRLSVGQRFCLCSFGGSDDFQKLLRSALSSLSRNAWDLSTAEFLAATGSLADLFLMALDRSPDVASVEQSVRAANLNRAKRIIRHRLADPDLTLTAVAAEAGISLSYLHQLFRPDGQTAYEYLKSERLLRAHSLLSSPLRRMAVFDACLKCGFVDKSFFSRAFKQKFGVSPSAVAAEANSQLAQRR